MTTFARLMTRATQLLAAGHPAAAIHLYYEAAALASTTEETYCCQHQLGICNGHLGEFHDALYLFEAACREAPADYRGLVLLSKAEVLQRKGQVDEACLAVVQGLALLPLPRHHNEWRQGLRLLASAVVGWPDLAELLPSPVGSL